MNKLVVILMLLLFHIHSECQQLPVTFLNQPTKDSLYNEVKDDIAFIQFEKGDTVADVGTFNGHDPAAYSLFADSVVFFLEDIVSEALRPFEAVLASYKIIADSKTHNEFKIVIGNDTTTTLPDNIFSKVILKDVLHHFNSKEKMLQDIKRIMKSDSKLFLYEPLKDKSKSSLTLCRGAMTKEEIVNELSEKGFELSKDNNGAERTKEFVRGNGVYCWFEFKLKEAKHDN